MSYSSGKVAGLTCWAWLAEKFGTHHRPARLVPHAPRRSLPTFPRRPSEPLAKATRTVSDTRTSAFLSPAAVATIYQLQRRGELANGVAFRTLSDHEPVIRVVDLETDSDNWTVVFQLPARQTQSRRNVTKPSEDDLAIAYMRLKLRPPRQSVRSA
ncbi:hypothetical protein HJC99_00775 [Candidatus Saccharibacteria bacterium]|nr:hypothetical protein [Candidatus Saccharibacteria bacterium]